MRIERKDFQDDASFELAQRREDKYWMERNQERERSKMRIAFKTKTFTGDTRIIEGSANDLRCWTTKNGDKYFGFKGQPPWGEKQDLRMVDEKTAGFLNIMDAEIQDHQEQLNRLVLERRRLLEKRHRCFKKFAGDDQVEPVKAPDTSKG
jgi:hypothetical protein